MNKIYSSITKNFTFLLGGQVIYKLLAFFTYILIARFMGVERFGQLSFGLSFVGLFAVCLDFGLSELLIRDVAGRIGELSNKYINNILSAKLVLTIVSYILIAILGLIFLQNPQIRIAILVLALCLALDSFTLFFRCIFRLFERMEFEALSLISEAILKLGFVFIALRFFGIGVLNVVYALLMVSLAIFILTTIISAIRFVMPKFRFDYIFVVNLFKKSLPFAFLIFFGVVNFKITIVIVSHLLDYIYAGWYSAAVRLIEPILIIPVTVAVAIFPTISRLYKDSKEEVITLLYRTSLKILFLMSIGIILLLNIFAGKIILFVFGKEYLNAIGPLRILSLSLIPFFLKFFLERFILALHKPNIIISSYILGTLIVIIASIILIGKIGYMGAGIALVLSEFFIVGYNIISIKR